MSTSVTRVALLGATGALGRALSRCLAAAGCEYRVVGRNLLPLEMRFKADPLAEIVVWDTEPIQLPPKSQADTFVERALAGTDTAVYLVGMPLWKFDQHLPLTRRVLAAARLARVRRLLLVSSCWAYGLPQTQQVSEDHPLGAETVKGRIRREQEALVLGAHGDENLRTAVLRVADCYGPHVEASFLWSPFEAARKGTHAQLPRPADIQHQFAYVPDVAATIVRLLQHDGGWGKAWNLGGVATTSLREMTEAIFAAAGRAPSYSVPPAWKLRIVAMLNPYVREMREMQYLLERPLLLDDSRLHGLLGGLEKTSYAEGIRGTLNLA